MRSVKEALDEIRGEFAEFTDSFDRYAYLVELAGLLLPYPEEYRTDAHLVRGCQSHVWLRITVEDGRFFFLADSDTLIIKGILYLLQAVLNDASAEDVAETELTLLADLEISESFSDARQKGIVSVAEALRSAAKEACRA